MAPSVILGQIVFYDDFLQGIEKLCIGFKDEFTGITAVPRKLTGRLFVFPLRLKGIYPVPQFSRIRFTQQGNLIAEAVDLGRFYDFRLVISGAVGDDTAVYGVRFSLSQLYLAFRAIFCQKQ